MIQIGVLTPHLAIGPEAEFPEMAPGRAVVRVMRVAADGEAGGVDRSSASSTELRALTAPPLLDRATRRLRAYAVDAIGYASTTSAYAIGFDAEAAIVLRLSQLAGLPAASTCLSAVRALRTLQVERVALIGAPWFEPELNQLGSVYFRAQGFDVVSSASAELSGDPRRIEPAAVCDWTSHHVRDDAEAVFIGGNGFRAAGAIEGLEVALGRPVLTSNQVLLWNLLAQVGDQISIDGFGQLFAHTPGTGVRGLHEPQQGQ